MTGLLERYKMDRLERLLELQKTFGKRFVNWDKLSIADQENWTKEFIVCCISELNEILAETNWKHWKSTHKELDHKKIKFEIIDLLHFILSLMVLWKMDATEVFDMYIEKNLENIKRQENGY